MGSRISSKAFKDALMNSVSDPDFDRLLEEFPGRGLEEFTSCTEPYKLGGNRKRVKHDVERSRYLYTLESTYLLTEVLLKSSFGLDLKLSRDHLCPRLPNRLDYIYWIYFDLLGYIDDNYPRVTCRPSQSVSEEIKANSGIFALDIGTGSSCIYPLLGTSISQQAHFVATDINAQSLQLCVLNLSKNFFVKSRIELVLRNPGDSLLGPFLERESEFDFSMCNPPFYSSSEELMQLQELKEANAPYMRLAAVDNELYTPGGEVQFIRNMIDESLLKKKAITWYTTLIGKKSTLLNTVAYLGSKGISNYCMHEITFGSTRRWTLGWTFTAFHGKSRLNSLSLKSLNPLMTYQKFEVPQRFRETLLDCIQRELTSLYLSTTWLDSYETPFSPNYHNHLDIVTHGDVWSRSFRRKTHGTRALQLNDEANLARFRLQWETVMELTLLDESLAEEPVILGMWWVYGHDFKVFESFHGFITRLISSIKAERV